VIAPRSLSKTSSGFGIGNAPGPGHYDLKSTETAKTGSYFVSKFRSTMCRTFGHSMRASLSTGTFV